MANYMCDFEIYGRVQGVFFRKYTSKTAKSLGLNGWVMNTDQGTVKGQLEGPVDKIRQMQNWLSKTGSPKSRIDKAEFGKIAEITDSQFKMFTIKR